jgi:hypothetical protein
MASFLQTTCRSGTSFGKMRYFFAFGLASFRETVCRPNVARAVRSAKSAIYSPRLASFRKNIIGTIVYLARRVMARTSAVYPIY